MRLHQKTQRRPTRMYSPPRRRKAPRLQPRRRAVKKLPPRPRLRPRQDLPAPVRQALRRTPVRLELLRQVRRAPPPRLRRRFPLPRRQFLLPRLAAGNRPLRPQAPRRRLLQRNRRRLASSSPC
jgi:hypothetical protein